MKPTCVSLGEQTSDGILFNGKSLLAGILVITDGSNPATVILYDNTAASGKKLFEAVVAGASNAALFMFDTHVQAENGIYLDIGGTGASCIVYRG